MKSHSRAVVIGGGIVGCSVLYHLAHLGWIDIVLLERRELTSGSTWHAAASMHRMNPNATMSRLQSYSSELYERLEGETGQSCSIHRPGGLYLASSRDRLDELRIQRARARYIDIDFELLAPQEIGRINPLVNTNGVYGGMFDPFDGHLDPSGVTHALAKGARQLGATIRRFSAVTSLSQTPGGGWLVRTNEGEIEAEVVVNAAGLWAREVARLAGVRLPLQPMEHQYLVTEAVPELAILGREMPLTRDYDYEFYMRQEGAGLLVGAYERDCRTWAERQTPLGFGQELLPADLERIEPNLERAVERVPAFGTAGIRRVVNGPMIFSPDGLPQLGPVPGLQNYYVAVGVMAGFSQGGGIGMALARWIVDGEPPMDLSFLDVARFGAFATQAYTRARVIENYGKRFGIGFPHEERRAGRPARTTPLYGKLLEAGGVMGAAYGFERPLHYALNGAGDEQLTFRRPPWFEAVGEEVRALRRDVALMDMSAYGKLLVEGPGAEFFLRRVFAGRLPGKAGRGALVPLLNLRGGIIGDYTIIRLAADRFYLIGAMAAEAAHMRWFERHRDCAEVYIRSVAAERGMLHIAGPRSRDLLSELSDEPVDKEALPFFAAREMELGPARCLVFRCSFTGDLGYELHFAAEQGPPLFDFIRERGEPMSLTLAGSRALDSLRLEKGFGRWALEFTADTNPYEAGLARFVDFDRSFVGREALVEKHSQVPDRSLVTLEIDAEDADAFGGEPVLADGELAGVVTSGGYGHHVRKSIALAYVRPAFIDRNDLEVEVLGERRPARAHREGLFDPTGSRMRC